MDKPSLEPAELNWKSLYTLGGVAALILLAYSLATMIIMVAIGGQPETAQEGLAMLQNNRLLGFLRMDGLTILVMPLYYLLFLDIYTALKKTDNAYATLATVLVFAGLTLLLATPSAFSWLSLSDKFAEATSEAQRNQLLAAGEAILASDMWHGSGPILGSILLQTGALLISVVMLWGKAFGKATAYVGVVMHGLDLARILIGLIFPSLSIIFMAVAGPLYLVWFPLLARDLFRLGRNEIKK
jgi:hypothetical protein